MKILFARSVRFLGALALGAALHTVATPIIATDADAACVAGVASTDVLNIRSGPGANFKIVGSIRPR